MTTMNAGDDDVRKPDSVGPPAPVCDVAVVPEDYDGEEPPPTSRPTPTGPGELWIKGPNVVRGYWNRPEDTARPSPEAGSTPATWPASTRRGSSISWTGPRT